MKHRLLVVDDDWAILELIRCTFKSSGFEICLARDDEEFRKKAREFKPDVIILDLMLGDKDGMQVYEQLLNEGFDATIPVVFLSALAGGRPSTPPRPGRTYALMGKPFDPEKLVREITTLVEAKS